MTAAARKQVLPRYGVGHAQNMVELTAAFESELPGITLTGRYLRGVSVEAVIASGRATATGLRDGAEEETA